MLEVTGWQVVAENVGVGGDWHSIEDAFMASPEHRENLLDPLFTQFGIGTAVSADGSLWVSQVFRAPSGATSSASTAQSSASGSSSIPVASAWTPPPPTPQQVLRGRLATARKQVHSARPADPLRSATDFATVMSTVGR